MDQRNQVAAAARPVNDPMSISALHCKAGGVKAAFIARSAKNYAKVCRLQTLKNRGRLLLIWLVTYYAPGSLCKALHSDPLLPVTNGGYGATQSRCMKCEWAAIPWAL